MARPRPRPDERETEDRLKEPASVLHEAVDLEGSLLDDAELGTEELPSYLEESQQLEREAEEYEAVLEARAAITPPTRLLGEDTIDPEELEARLEQAAEPAELLSLHDEDTLAETLLDEGGSLEGTDAESDEDFDERLFAEEDELEEPRPGLVSTGRLALSPHERARIRELLEAEQLRLVALRHDFEEEGLRAHSEREDLSSLSAVDQHPADVGTETFDRERDLSIREQVEGELSEVTKALGRLKDGSYGICEACGDPIGWERLEAEPATRLCLADQRELEYELALKHREVEI